MTEEASIQFLQWCSLYETEKPFQIFMNLLPDAEDRRKTNLRWEERPVLVEDFRERAPEFQLDTHGFTTRHLPGFTELPDRRVITEEYIPAVKKMLQREMEDVGTVFVFDWRVRCGVFRNIQDSHESILTTMVQIRNSRGTTLAGNKINFSDQTQPLLPSNYAHIDTSPISVIKRVRDSFPDDAAKILRQRIRAVK